MKKTFRLLGMMLLVVAISMNMVSCSESDNEVAADICGKWYFEHMDVHQCLNPDLIGLDTSITEWMDLKKDGTVLFYDTELEAVLTGKYTLKGNQLSIHSIDHNEYLSYVYTVKKLTEEELTLGIEMPGILSATVYMTR